jgi:hypothetical protein
MKKGVDFTLPWGQTNKEEVDLGVEDADREEEEADLGVEDANRDEEEANLRHGVPAATGAEEALRSSQPPRTSTHRRFLTSEVEEEARRGRRTAVGSGEPYKERRKLWRVKEVSPFGGPKARQA